MRIHTTAHIPKYAKIAYNEGTRVTFHFGALDPNNTRKTENALSSIRNIMKAALYTPRSNGRWGLPILFESDPGVGKSSTTEENARSWDLKPITIIASLRPPEDFLGFPMVAEEGEFFSYKPPRWVKEATDAKRALVFFDEMTAGMSGRVFAAMLRIILEGVVGEAVLPKGVRFVGACNPPEQSPGGQDLPMPLANRFGHFKYETPTVQEWTAWLMEADLQQGGTTDVEFNAEDEEKRVMAAWTEAFAWASGVWAGAVNANTEVLHKPPSVNSKDASHGWPSPRSNEFACRALASSRVHGLSDVEQDEFVAGFIGPAAAGQIMHFMRNQDLPAAVDVLDGKVKFKHDKRRYDRTIAVVQSCVKLVTPADAPRRKERAGNLWKLLEDVAKDAGDLVVPTITPLYKAKLTSVAEAKPVLRKLAPVLAAAGVRMGGGQ